MGIALQWHDPEQTIVLEVFTPGWTWDEFHAAGDEYVSMVESVEHPVALIIDIRQIGPPPSTYVMGHFRSMAHRLAGRCEMAVVIVDGGIMEVTGKVFAQAYQSSQRPVRFLHSLEEALEVIARRRSGQDTRSGND